MVTTGYSGMPAWKAWTPSDDSIRMDAADLMDPTSSADSLPTPSTSYVPVKAEPVSRQELQKQAQASKEEERAKKLKEASTLDDWTVHIFSSARYTRAILAS